MQPSNENALASPAPAGDVIDAPAVVRARTPWQRLGDLVFTTDAKQRLRITRSLMSAMVFVVCVGLIVYCSYIGLMQPQDGFLLAACIFVSCTGFYIALRTGFNRRFKDPALTLPQIIAALTWICGAYAITNDGHGGTLMLFALVLVFGIFNMDATGARLSSAYAVVAMGATMAYKGWTDPEHYPVKIEWMYFVFVVTIMPTISQLAVQLTRMRERLKAQKAELETALARIQELATLDELTGLINRRQMLTLLTEHAMRDKRNALGFFVGIVDLDHFKRVNDTWGHGVGDEVLRGFAQEARRVLRETDVIARWGGEEFLLIMPATPPGHPRTGVERLRDCLAKMQISSSVPDLRVSFSAGLTSYRKGEAIDVAIERADKALYEAKSGGRNRTIEAE